MAAEFRLLPPKPESTLRLTKPHDGAVIAADDGFGV